MDWANTTAVIDVQAGDTLEIGHQRAEPSEWNENFFKGCPGGRITCDPRYYLVGLICVTEAGKMIVFGRLELMKWHRISIILVRRLCICLKCLKVRMSLRMMGQVSG